MATDKININVTAEDNASAVLNNVKSRLSGLYSSIGSLNYGLRQYNAAMNSVNRMMINTVKEAGSAIFDFTSDSINAFSELSEQHAKTLGAMANDYDKTLESQQKFMENSEKLKQQAIDIAKYGTTINGVTSNGSLLSPVQISEAQTELVKAGVKSEDMLNTDIVSQIVQFASANDLKTGEAVEFAVSLGSQFGVDYEGWGDMLDKVSHTADLSIIDVADIVQSMKYAGGISSGINRSMEETLGLISVMGNYGLIGSQAGSGIQAFLTRLLTGDTTVITDAQKQVAPPKALKAFYDFSNYAKSDGSEITYDDIINERFTEKDITGNLRPMAEIITELETTMDSLDDEEQAWFAKKLFGLYQMKSAYALINGDDADQSITDVVNNIENQSEGTNANKLSLLLDSQSGSITALENTVTAIKTEVGEMLSPVVSAGIEELRNYLQDPENYEINWNNIQEALDKSCDDIEEAYGKAIADAVRNIGSLTIDLGQIVETTAPELGTGLLEVLGDLTSGDFGSVAKDWSEMIGNMNTAVDGLPEDLQDLGKNVVGVIDMFGKLATLNIATTIAQLVTSVMQIAMMTINAASVIVNGTSVTGGGGTGGVTTGGTGGTTGGTGGKVGNTVKNVAKIGGAIGGAYLGSKASDVTGDWAETIAENAGADEGTKETAGEVTKLATVAGAAAGGSALASWVTGGGLSSAISSEIAAIGAAEAGTAGAMGIGAISGGIMGLVGAGTVAMFVNMGIEGERKRRNIQDTVDIYNRGETVAYNPDGSMMRDADGNAMTVEQIRKDWQKLMNDRMNPYEYGNGIDYRYQPKEPAKNLWNWFGNTNSYKEEYAEWERKQAEGDRIIEEAKKQFYTVQDNYAIATGGQMLKYDDYTAKQEYYDENFSTLESAITALGGSIDNLNVALAASNLGSSIEEIKSSIDALSMDQINQATGFDFSKVIPGFMAYSEQGQKQAIENYLTNEIEVKPVFKMDAPQVNVKVNVDHNGQVTTEKNILNPNFNNSINTWYQKITSQNGNTPK